MKSRSRLRRQFVFQPAEAPTDLGSGAERAMRSGVASAVAQRLFQNAERGVDLGMDHVAQRAHAQIRKHGEHLVDQRRQRATQRVGVQRRYAVHQRLEPPLQYVRFVRERLEQRGKRPGFSDAPELLADRLEALRHARGPGLGGRAGIAEARQAQSDIRTGRHVVGLRVGVQRLAQPDRMQKGMAERHRSPSHRNANRYRG